MRMPREALEGDGGHILRPMQKFVSPEWPRQAAVAHAPALPAGAGARGAASSAYRAAKRAGDVLVAGLLLLLLLPLLVLIVLSIVLRDGRPALYFQYRTGLGGRPF